MIQLPQSVDVALRPLNKGVIKNIPSQTLPPGAFLTLKNYLSSNSGLVRRPGFQTFAANQSVDNRFVDLVTLWKTDGTQVSILLCEDFAYLVGVLTGYTALYWNHTGGALAKTSGIFAIGTGTTWETAGIMAGDYIEVTTTGGLMQEITSVDSPTQIRTDVTVGAFPTGADYVIRRSFKCEKPYLIDWIVHRNELIVTGINIPLLVYNPATVSFEEFVDNPAYLPVTGTFKANCVASFLDRLWVGSTHDNVDGYRRQRIRWSLATNERDFSTLTAYLDLPYVSGELKRLLPMGNILVAYFDDAIFFGTETNIPGLPVAFNRIETGFNGLIGPKAVVSWLGGHFAVLQDDIYFVSNNGLEPIGTPIVRETIRKCKQPWRIYAVADPVRNAVCFGFPVDDDIMESIWVFEYRAKAWSQYDLQTWMVANPLVNVSLTWDDLTGTWDTLEASAPTWDDLKYDDPFRNLFIEQDYTLWKANDTFEGDGSAHTAIPCVIESPDFDFNEPDSLKLVSRISMKVDFEAGEENGLTFKAWVSTNRGRDYRPVGSLIIKAGEDEGYVNFRAVGSTFRFKLTSSDEVQSYVITEFVLRVVGGGTETSTGFQADV